MADDRERMRAWLHGIVDDACVADEASAHVEVGYRAIASGTSVRREEPNGTYVLTLTWKTGSRRTSSLKESV